MCWCVWSHLCDCVYSYCRCDYVLAYVFLKHFIFVERSEYTQCGLVFVQTAFKLYLCVCSPWIVIDNTHSVVPCQDSVLAACKSGLHNFQKTIIKRIQRAEGNSTGFCQHKQQICFYEAFSHSNMYCLWYTVDFKHK